MGFSQFEISNYIDFVYITARVMQKAIKEKCIIATKIWSSENWPKVNQILEEHHTGTFLSFLFPQVNLAKAIPCPIQLSLIHY